MPRASPMILLRWFRRSRKLSEFCRLALPSKERGQARLPHLRDPPVDAFLLSPESLSIKPNSSKPGQLKVGKAGLLPLLASLNFLQPPNFDAERFTVMQQRIAFRRRQVMRFDHG